MLAGNYQTVYTSYKHWNAVLTAVERVYSNIPQYYNLQYSGQYLGALAPALSKLHSIVFVICELITQ